MKISFNWLKDFVDIADAPPALATRFTSIGLAVDALETTGNDSIFELDVATNRPDRLNHLGVAREVSVVYGSALRTPGFDLHEAEQRAQDIFSISISDPELCARYCGRYIEGVRIGPSPDWLKSRLESLGGRSINNVADVTNYVMLELGQPLHAFAAETVTGRQIIVRRAHGSEKITTLDGVERELDPSILVIADSTRAIAIAGVMGGAETEISPATTSVLLESANFDPLSIRKTSRTLGLSTEASYRFERGADPEMARFACDRAAAMIRELGGGKIYRDVIDVYPVQKQRAVATLRRQKIAGFLGAPVDDDIVDRIFRGLGFKITGIEAGWSVEVPAHRVDIRREEDLLEEVARHHGFDKFPATLPAWSGSGSALPAESRERLLRSRLASAGYSEITTMVFSNEPDERKFRADTVPVRLVNPMAEDESILRTSLIPSMLRTIERNRNHGLRDLQIYELAKVYRDGAENRSLLLAGTGALRTKTVHETARDFDFYDLKGDVEDIFRSFDLNMTLSRENLPSYYHPGRSARYGEIALFGQLHPAYAEMFKLRHNVYLAELDVELILASRPRRSVEPVQRFPAIRRDLSLLLDKGIQYEEVRATIASAKIPELTRIEPFDRMESGSFDTSKYSLSISLNYQSSARTLTDDEVEQFELQILGLLEQRLGARLRK